MTVGLPFMFLDEVFIAVMWAGFLLISLSSSPLLSLNGRISILLKYAFLSS